MRARRIIDLMGPNAMRLVLACCLLAWSITALPAEPGLELGQYAGKVVYLDFWASWCSPCRQSFPWMNAMQQKYGPQGLVIVAVNVDEQHADAVKFLGEVPASFKVVFDPEGHFAEEYHLAGMPSSFLIDRSGTLARSHYGFHSDDEIEFESEIRSLLIK